MQKYALIAAGFSRNWGGWLSEEVFDYLLSQPEIESDPKLKEILWSHSDDGFESALEQLQRDATDPASSDAEIHRLQAMQSAIVRMFGEMNGAFFKRTEFEFQNQRHASIREFLSRFDGLFSLNQDLLLEHHYIDTFDISLSSSRKWNFVQIPGMRRGRVEDPLFDKSWARAQWEPLPNAEYRIETGAQPFIKLHGSANWISSKGQPLLIVGGNKPGQIQQHKILRRYATEFENRLRQPNVRLMVIGYGFKDHHINQEIAHAVYNHNLKFFVVAPEGRKLAKVFSSPTLPGAAMAVFKYDLGAVFQRGLAGVSQRLLSETFGGDDLELQKLIRFLE